MVFDSTPFCGMFLASREWALLVSLRQSSSCFSGSFPQVQASPVYFDREDVKMALHAPVNTTWTICTRIVFPDGDSSLPPALTVLPGVIEKTKRTVIMHGLADFVYIAEG
jgi:carboxypeptidase D